MFTCDLSLSPNVRCRSAGYQDDHAENHATPFGKEHHDRVYLAVWLVRVFALVIYSLMAPFPSQNVISESEGMYGLCRPYRSGG